LVYEQSDFLYTWRQDDSASVNFPEFCNENEEEIEYLLLKHGAILFKGFGVDSPQNLQDCVDAMPGTLLNYVDGNSPRTKLSGSGNIYTSTEHPSELFISLHSELSYAAKWPSHLYFCCQIAPKEGGNTLVADNRAILASLPKELVDMFAQKGLKYIRNLHNGSGAMFGNSWQDTFETSDKAAVEQHCRENDIQYQWKADGGIRIIQKRVGIARHPTTGDSVWFNQADQFHPSTNPPEVYEAIMELFPDPLDMPQWVCFGDDTPIDTDIFEVVTSTTKQHTVYFPWEKGDFLVLDNMLVSHGRSPFSGDRRILVAMSA